jgi:hypothetical protein
MPLVSPPDSRHCAFEGSLAVEGGRAQAPSPHRMGRGTGVRGLGVSAATGIRCAQLLANLRTRGSRDAHQGESHGRCRPGAGLDGRHAQYSGFPTGRSEGCRSICLKRNASNTSSTESPGASISSRPKHQRVRARVCARHVPRRNARKHRHNPRERPELGPRVRPLEDKNRRAEPDENRQG